MTSEANTQLSQLGELPERGDRPGAIEILQRQARDRIPELVPVRYWRMSQSAFAFLRGAAAVMADDLVAAPNSGIVTQLCGDAHLSNFGVYLSPERRMIFDINDFDETYPGPFEWDVKRLATSFVVASLANGFSPKTARLMARQVAKYYRKNIAKSAGESTLDNWYAAVDTKKALDDIGSRLDTSQRSETRKALAKAQHRNSAQALAKLAVVVDGELRIKNNPPLLAQLSELYSADQAHEVQETIEHRLREYRETLSPGLATLFDQFTPVDIAHKVVGVGSVGTRCWVALLIGTGAKDPLFLQIKQALPSVLSVQHTHYTYPTQGTRVVVGQRIMQASGDIFLGWCSGVETDGVTRDYYVRQLRDGKGAVVVESLDTKAMSTYARLCATALAQSHARTNALHAIAEYLGDGKEFDGIIEDWAARYAARNADDFAAMTAAIHAKKLPTEEF